MPLVILDNGASTVKAGVFGRDPVPRLVPNAVVRSKGDKATYIGHELARCRDYSALHFRLPFEKGYLVDWDAQKAVWDGIFSDEVLGIDTTASTLLLTEPYFNLPNIQDTYDQLIFEEYEFAAYYRCTPASLVPSGSLFASPPPFDPPSPPADDDMDTRTSADAGLNAHVNADAPTPPHPLPAPQCTIIVDAGFSFTHIVPIMDGQIVWGAVKRLDVGGKLLTNHLKELVSFRQWNMMDETHIMNDVKERCCYVARDFVRELEVCRTTPRATNPIVQEYILPDLSANRAGRVRVPSEGAGNDNNSGAGGANDQILVMANERFSVPEVMFRPDDIGLQQAGLPSTIAHCIGLLPAPLRGMFWAHIGLVGGSTKFDGFRRRLFFSFDILNRFFQETHKAVWTADSVSLLRVCLVRRDMHGHCAVLRHRIPALPARFPFSRFFVFPCIIFQRQQHTSTYVLSYFGSFTTRRSAI